MIICKYNPFKRIFGKKGGIIAKKSDKYFFVCLILWKMLLKNRICSRTQEFLHKFSRVPKSMQLGRDFLNLFGTAEKSDS